MLQDLVGEMMRQRRLLLLHQTNHAAIEKALHGAPGHDVGHEDIEAMMRRTLADPSLPVRDRVRMASAIGAVYGAMAQSSEALSDIAPEELLVAVREVLRDVLRPTRSPRAAKG